MLVSLGQFVLSCACRRKVQTRRILTSSLMEVSSLPALEVLFQPYFVEFVWDLATLSSSAAHSDGPHNFQSSMDQHVPVHQPSGIPPRCRIHPALSHADPLCAIQSYIFQKCETHQKILQRYSEIRLSESPPQQGYFLLRKSLAGALCIL